MYIHCSGIFVDTCENLTSVMWHCGWICVPSNDKRQIPLWEDPKCAVFGKPGDNIEVGFVRLVCACVVRVTSKLCVAVGCSGDNLHLGCLRLINVNSDLQ